MTAAQCQIRFENLDAIKPGVERLPGGDSPVGNWSLGQMCRHPSTILRFSVDVLEYGLSVTEVHQRRSAVA